ncbi:MAG: T9SS type A sorting domain-containing protein [Bacteroidetes bacterium]|nr:T9SS type A sorting domain-containing protein [Bacteroidota bacterium]
MKKNLLLSSLVISALSVNAQIQINTGDMPVAGKTFVMANDTTITSYGSAGTNQSWNFASWANQSTDTTAFSTPSSVAGSSFFPTATLGVGAGDMTSFMKNASSQIDILGFYGDFGFGPMAVQFTPAQKFLSFPSNYMTNYSGTSKYELKFYLGQPGFDSMKVKASINYTSSIDAWGTLTTPVNSNLSTLRQKYIEITTDSIFLLPTGQPWMLNPSAPGDPNPRKDTTNSYRWWSNVEKFPVAEVITDGNNVVTNAGYLLSTLVGVKEQSMTKNELNVYPNPASDKINITGLSTESYLVIFDVNGKLIERTRLKKNNTSINTSNYENGIYFYQITALTGKPVGKGKFIVSK